MNNSPISETRTPERDANVSILYHASPIQGLTQLEPRIGTHGHAWVYATPDIVIASLFLGRLGGDLTCQIGTIDGRPYLQERFVGAFDLRYDIGGASLYRLSAAGFSSGKTSWKQDWVCAHPVLPLEETAIGNVRDYLLGLVGEGRLALHRCEHTATSAETDTDLLQTFVKLYARGSDKVLAHVAHYYPHLASPLDQRIAVQKQQQQNTF